MSLLLLTFLALSDQALAARQLSGQIQLRAAATLVDLQLEVEVRNHSFAVLPDFGFIRPITSRESTVVRIGAGQQSANYTINNIIENPVDYSVRIRCLNCSTSVATQFYVDGGTATALVNAAYIDPDDLAPQLDLSIASKAQIAGSLLLKDTVPASRDLLFRVSVFDAVYDEPAISSQIVELAKGNTQVDYFFSGIDRFYDQLNVKVKCLNCIGVAAATFNYPMPLAASLNHPNIDFVVQSSAPLPIGALLELLLSDD